MRKVETDDLFLLSEIIDKMEVELPQIQAKHGLVTRKDQEQYGMQLGFVLLARCIKLKMKYLLF